MVLTWRLILDDNQGIEPRDRTQGSNPGTPDSLPAEPQGKPKDSGVGSLSFLQRIFPTQESPALQVDSYPIELPGKPDAN